MSFGDEDMKVRSKAFRLKGAIHGRYKSLAQLTPLLPSQRKENHELTHFVILEIPSGAFDEETSDVDASTRARLDLGSWITNHL